MTDIHLLKLGLSIRASYLHREHTTRIQRSDGRQRPVDHLNGLQLVPQKMMLDNVIGLLKVHKAGIQRVLGNASCVIEVLQGKEVMVWRLPEPEACLGQAAQPVLFRSPHQRSVDYDFVPPVKGLAHSYGPVVGGKGANLFVDRGDER